MEVQLIRNATLKLKYAGKTILVDPMLCPSNTFPPFAKGLKKNPTVDLLLPVEEILKDLDAVLVTHMHPDHFDEASKAALSKDIKLFCTPVDKDHLLFKDFKNKEIVADKLEWENLSIERIEGQHGSGPILRYMGQMSGYVLKSAEEPTLYIVGDSILTEVIRNSIKEHQPDLIICNSGGGILPGFENYPVMLDEAQTVELVNITSNSIVLPVHLESIDFCRVTRKSLRAFADNKGIPAERLLILKDAEKMSFAEK